MPSLVSILIYVGHPCASHGKPAAVPSALNGLACVSSWWGQDRRRQRRCPRHNPNLARPLRATCSPNPPSTRSETGSNSVQPGRSSWERKRAGPLAHYPCLAFDRLAGLPGPLPHPRSQQQAEDELSLHLADMQRCGALSGLAGNRRYGLRALHQTYVGCRQFQGPWLAARARSGGLSSTSRLQLWPRELSSGFVAKQAGGDGGCKGGPPCDAKQDVRTLEWWRDGRLP